MKPIITIRNKNHLMKLIYDEIQESGNNCDLNHLDISSLTDISRIFFVYNEFNGDISEWNVSKVENMSKLFKNSKFNGDISNWDVSNVKNMEEMFESSIFNSDISKWDVSKLEKIHRIFVSSKFTGDITNWKPYALSYLNHAFHEAEVVVPYWAEYKSKEERNAAIFEKELSKDHNKNNISKKIKI